MAFNIMQASQRPFILSYGHDISDNMRSATENKVHRKKLVKSVAKEIGFLAQESYGWCPQASMDSSSSLSYPLICFLTGYGSFAEKLHSFDLSNGTVCRFGIRKRLVSLICEYDIYSNLHHDIIV